MDEGIKMELIDKLKELVTKYQVCYEVFQAEEFVKDKIQKVGFNDECETKCL